jgi:hypothetical protein
MDNEFYTPATGREMSELTARESLIRSSFHGIHAFLALITNEG